MQKQVLSLLKQTDGYLSGEEISRQLGVSRAAVWKAVKALREKGYGIDSVTNRGYCLSSQPDLLDATAIQSGLSTHFLGRNIVVLEETDSTNEEAKRQRGRSSRRHSLFSRTSDRWKRPSGAVLVLASRCWRVDVLAAPSSAGPSGSHSAHFNRRFICVPGDPPSHRLRRHD